MNLKNCNLFYLVEGECDEAVVRALKEKYIHSGKIKVINVATKKVSDLVRRSIKTSTVCVLIFDTDIFNAGKGNSKIILENISKLEKSPNVKKVIIICQDQNLEDEIVRATSIKNIKDLLGSKTVTDFKREVISCSNLLKKFEDKDFDISKFWTQPNLAFVKKPNEADLIKK